MMETRGVRSRSVRSHAPGGAKETPAGGVFTGTPVTRSLLAVNQPLLETEMRFQS
jgi:hypothetical protein